MKKVLILVEGQAEETFAREALGPYLSGRGVYPQAKLATTKRVKSGSDFKGGIVSYGKVKNDIIRLLGDTNAEVVTTMIDFYGLPDSFPGRRTMPAGSCYAQVAYLEEEFRKDINHHKFLPYLMLHEFEAMLFVAPEEIAQAFPNINKYAELTAVKAEFGSPEEIDDDPKTAPSRRIQGFFPGYQKTLDGPLIILEIGLDRIRSECPYFNYWIESLERLGTS